MKKGRWSGLTFTSSLDWEFVYLDTEAYAWLLREAEEWDGTQRVVSRSRGYAGVAEEE